MSSIDKTNNDAAIEEALEAALGAADGERLTEVVESLPSHDTLRHVSHLAPEERGRVVSLISQEAAAGLVEEAPEQLAASLIEGLESPVAAKIMKELDSDTQADIVQELETDEAEAILSEMDPKEAAGVRKLAQYAPDTSGGLMESEIFSFRTTDTVSAVLQRMASGDEDFERYRGQHPYIIDEAGKLVGVVSLRGLLTSKRSGSLVEIMSPPQTVTADTTLDDLESFFEEHPFLGVPVVDGQGTPLGIVARAAVAEAALKRAEHDSLSRQRVSDELRSMLPGFVPGADWPG